MPPILFALIAGGIFAYLMTRSQKTPAASGKTQGLSLGSVEPPQRVAPVTLSTALSQTLSLVEQSNFLRALQGYRLLDRPGAPWPSMPLGVSLPTDGGSDAAVLLPPPAKEGVGALGIVAAANRFGHAILVSVAEPSTGRRGLISLNADVDHRPFIVPGSNWFLFLSPNTVDDVAKNASVTLPNVQPATSNAVPGNALAQVLPPPKGEAATDAPPATPEAVAEIEQKATLPADELPESVFPGESKVWGRAKAASNDAEKAAVIPDLVADSAVLKAKGYDLASSQFLTQATTYGYVAAPKA